MPYNELVHQLTSSNPDEGPYPVLVHVPSVHEGHVRNDLSNAHESKKHEALLYDEGIKKKVQYKSRCAKGNSAVIMTQEVDVLNESTNAVIR